MSDKINAENISNNYNYKIPNFQNCKECNNENVEFFKIDNDENIEDLHKSLQNEESEENSDFNTQLNDLKEKLSNVKDEQGIIGSAWNAIKCLTNLGSSTEKCEKAIEDFEAGKISYEEADKVISEFSSKQKSSVNMISNITTGVVTALLVGSAVATGGLSLGVVAAGVGIGAATKAGMKFADRATNKVEDDALDAKQIVKDSLSGAVEGVATTCTMGIGNAAVAGEAVASQTLKQTVIEGAKSGAKSGAIAGAITGAGDYGIEAFMEEDVKFSVKGMAYSATANALGGAVAGGVIGGVSSGIQYKNTNTSVETIADDSVEASVKANNSVKEVADDSIEASTNAKVDNSIEEVANDSVETSTNAKADNSVEEVADDSIEASADVKADNSVEKVADDSVEASADAKTKNNVKATEDEESMETIINNKLQQNSKDDLIELNYDNASKLYDNASKLNKLYEKNINEATIQIKNQFDELSSVEKVTGRAKSLKSTFNKLAEKFKKGNLKSCSEEDCLSAIGDAYGTRVQMKSIGEEESRKIIEKGLKGTDVSYEQFVKYVNGAKSELDDSILDSLDNVSQDILNSLKEKQTEEVVDTLIKGIKDKSIQITELNNYGDEVSSYFTEKQLMEIADVYKNETGKKLTIVTKASEDLKSQVSANNDGYLEGETFILKEKGSVKDSGYASTQMNVNHEFENKTVGQGELQIRGTQLNEFADVEHIPYDIRTNKITANDKKYSKIYDVIKKMDDESYSKYNSYLNDEYNYLRLKELGIETKEPVLEGKFYESNTHEDISKEVIEKLSKSGLLLYSEK